METARSQARKQSRVPVDFYVNKMINGVPHLARTKNLSREGLYLHRLLEPLTPPRARISLEFMLPGTDEIIWTEAVVVHGRNTRRGVGLRFVDLSPRQAEIIEEFIERNEAIAS
ncbi:PilZ domain-containing protein [Myxococcota bacterium]|nr:PilZ domain-containing protein [Myxococcota bacterium]